MCKKEYSKLLESCFILCVAGYDWMGRLNSKMWPDKNVVQGEKAER